MTKRRTWATACGLVVLLGLGGMAHTRAQQTASKAEPPRSARKALRTRIIALRAEVAMLELERDAIRAGLLKLLEGVEEGDILGIDVPALLGTAKVELAGISGDAGALREMSDLMSKLQESDETKVGETLAALKKAFDKQKVDFRAGVERKKQEYARKVRALAEKTLDLEDAEGRYRRID